MYELSRVRLFSVGPPGARYQDVQLDLRGVGPAVPATAHQVDLFAPDDLERVPRRPAQASVLFLENGGGKSVLLKLVFSVVLPGKRQVVGTTSTTVLEKFVLAEDVAHVALEWMDTRTGALLVTGKISEWRGHVASSDPEKLTSAWYSFRPNAEFGLDDLPFTAEGRRVTTTGFKDRLTEQHRQLPALELVWETGPGDWTRHLVDVGLDPELFRYQREMNAGEGEAAETFSFPTDEAFVDFLLRAVIDPDEPRNLADLVAGYAHRLAERADLERERDFVEGTLERLGPLIDAESGAATAREAEAAAQRAAGVLAAALAARRAEESERLGTALSSLADAREQVGRAESDERRLEAVTLELRRLVAVLELDATRAAEDVAQHVHETAQQSLAAWQAVVPVLRHEVAEAEAARLRGMVAAEQERARPALESRQDAARALAAGLRRMAEAADATALTAADAATEADSRADAARAAELAHATAAATERAATAQAREAAHDVDEAVADAVRAAHLGKGDDVAAAHTAAEAAERTAIADVAALHSELTTLRSKRLRAEGERGALRGVADAARQTVERAEAALEKAAAARDALAGEPRLADLLGVEEIQPETDASALLDQLRAAIDASDHSRIALLAAQERDTRALKALGAGGLLPEPVEVEQVIEVLERAGITAYSGWRYLTMLAAPQRASVLQRLPHLVSGVLLNNPDDASRARAELERARLLPCAVVAVGAAAGMGAETAAAPGVVFVVPPNPAMFDEAEAEATRATLEIETDSRASELASRTALLETDRGLLARLRDWTQRHPSGELEALAATADAAHAAVTAADRAVRNADADIAALDERTAQLEQDQPRLDGCADTARARTAVLATLRTQVQRLPELRERVRATDAAVERAEQQAERARAEAATARGAAEEARRTRDRQRRVAESCREELAALPLDGTWDDGSRGAPEKSSPTLEVLRATYINAAAAYAAAEVDTDLQGALRQAERDAAITQSTLDELTEQARTDAGALLVTPDAADPAARRGATEQARAATVSSAADLTAATAERKLAERTLRGFTAPPCSVDPYRAPAHLQEGREIIERAAADLRAATARAAAARDTAAAAQAAEQAATNSSEGFRRVVESLDDPPAPAPGAQPFRGDVDAAHAQWKAHRSAVRAAAGARAAADREVRAATDAVAQFAQEARFSTVTSPVRKHVVGVVRTEMPALAAEWQAALRPRLRTLDDDLANIVRHRSGIVTRLQGMVREALRTLRLAQRLSELPEGLSDWSGQQFLRIRFEELDDVLLHHELSEVVDRVAEERRSGRGPQQRDGMSLLLRGVRAAMPKGVRAEMLKPDAVLRTERLRVSEIRDVFSGGQQLTAAIVLYCTMASLRAHQRGDGRRPHAGVLFLDNPIGRASAGYLLELQFGVAQALGVQLIYTTGLFDAGALSAFPLIIRLRNDADLRAGRKYLSVADRAAQHVAELTAPDGTGRLAATRIYRRPDPTTP